MDEHWGYWTKPFKEVHKITGIEIPRCREADPSNGGLALYSLERHICDAVPKFGF